MPITPTTMRIQPTVCRSMPFTVSCTAKARIGAHRDQEDADADTHVVLSSS